MKIDKRDIGNRAYAARDSLSLKQLDVSLAIGIHQATYSKFENGKYDMPMTELIKLCEYLHISVSWLLGEKTDNKLTDSEYAELQAYRQYLISKRSK